MSKPAGTTAVPNTLIESAKFNAVVDDIISDLNLARPISAGGTGATTAADARTALGISATNTPFTPTGTIAATNTQAAIAELDTDMQARVTEIQARALRANPRVDVATASTVNLAATTSTDYINLTGTTTITSFGTGGTVGLRYICRANAAFTITNGASLITKSGANITTGAGDLFEMVLETGDVWRMLDYTRSQIAAFYTRVAPVATTSGTAVDFSGLPSDVVRIEITINNVSLSGTDNILIQLGDAGGIETTGYVSRATSGTGSPVTSTSGFIIISVGAAFGNSGMVTLLRTTGETWFASGCFTYPGAIANIVGTKTLSEVLTTVRVTRTGTDTFDLGDVSIQYLRAS